MPRGTPDLFCQATPELLCREILLVYRADTCANVTLDEFTIYKSISCSEAAKVAHNSNSEQADLSKVLLCPEAALLSFSEAGGEQLQAYYLGGTLESRAMRGTAK